MNLHKDIQKFIDGIDNTALSWTLSGSTAVSDAFTLSLVKDFLLTVFEGTTEIGSTLNNHQLFLSKVPNGTSLVLVNSFNHDLLHIRVSEEGTLIYVDFIEG